MKQVTIYTDGACSGNPGLYGYIPSSYHIQILP